MWKCHVLETCEVLSLKQMGWGLLEVSLLVHQTRRLVHIHKRYRQESLLWRGQGAVEITVLSQ